jgi:Tfp pilus assembly protein PilF
MNKAVLKSNTKSFYILISIIVLISFISKWPVLSATTLSFDDSQYLTENVLVQNPSFSSAFIFIKEIIRPSTVQGYYQPITMISLMISYALGGRPENLFIFHVTNLVLHILNTIVIMLILKKLFKNVYIAAIVALFFGIHPLTIEPVAWISEVKTLSSTFFLLLCLTFYLIYLEKKKKPLYWASLLVFILSLMCKPTSTLLPLLLLCIDFWPLNRFDISFKSENLKIVYEKIPFFIIAIISSLITYFSQKITASAYLPGQGRPVSEIVLTIFYNIYFYILKILLPINLTSSYPVPNPIDLSNPEILVSLIFSTILIIIIIFSLKKTRAIFTGFSFFLIALFPTLGIIRFTYALSSDKYIYMPILGILIILAWTLNLIYEKYLKKIDKSKIYVLITPIIIIYILEIFCSYQYLYKWSDSETLHKYMLSLNPNSAILNNGYAIIIANKNRVDEALPYFKKAVALDPNYGEAIYYLGVIEYQKGNLDNATNYFSSAIEKDLDYIDAYLGLGTIYTSQGKYLKAINVLKKAIQVEPNNITAHMNLAFIYENTDNINLAIQEYKTVLNINPGLFDVQNRINMLQAHNDDI